MTDRQPTGPHTADRLAASAFGASTLRDSDGRADVVVVILDDGPVGHDTVAALLARGTRVAVSGRDVHQLIRYSAARFAGRTAVFLADPTDAHQIDLVVERATERLGPVTMIVDPAGASYRRPHTNAA